MRRIRSVCSAAPLSTSGLFYFERRSRPADGSLTPPRPSSPPHQRLDTPADQSVFFSTFRMNETPSPGFLTSREKHTGSLMTSQSTRYSSLMFKGGGLKRRRRRRRAHASGEKKRTKQILSFGFFVFFFVCGVFSRFFFLSCKVNVGGVSVSGSVCRSGGRRRH